LTFETATSTENLLPVELTIHDQYGRETRCALYTLPAIIGRDEQADVQLTDPWVSHRHCEIDQIGDVLVVRDLDSKNGVFIRGHRVRESQVLSGERLTVARTEVVVRYPGTAKRRLQPR
jgi:pSer/pThr/pTyr-binding forkhead associated (FHA) protein